MIGADLLAPLVVAARTLLALVFLSAGIGKLRDRNAFHGAVHAYRLLPAGVVAPAALLIPLMEVGLGSLLPTGLAPRAAGFAAAALLLAFAVAMTTNILRGRRHIDCGCFQGRAAQQLSALAVLRTICLGTFGLLAALPSRVALFDAVQGLAAGGILFLLFTALTLLPTFGRQRPRISL